MFILLEMFDYDLGGNVEVLERKMSEIKMILVYYWGLLHLKRHEYKENSSFFLEIHPLLCVLIDIKCEGLQCE